MENDLKTEEERTNEEDNHEGTEKEEKKETNAENLDVRASGPGFEPVENGNQIKELQKLDQNVSFESIISR